MDIEVILFGVGCFFLVSASAVIRVWIKGGKEARALARYNEVQRAGLVIPPTLHPVFDPNRCIGSGACTHVCPQGMDVIGRINGRGAHIDPSMCIGHGRCAAECPMGAIRLVFGTSERGVDIPHLQPTFETNVEGIYITGELGGMGLIVNAVRQAREGMANLAATLSKRDRTALKAGDGEVVDVAVVGAGPAGLTAALSAIELGLSYRLFDREAELGGALRHYPRRKVVMTRPVHMPLVGQVHSGTLTKEQLLELWQSIITEHRITLESGVTVDAITKNDAGIFTLTGDGVTARARRVMLTIGRRGTPRKLGVPGEERTTVFYAMLEPEIHVGRRVLVVGGGNAAIEAACTLAEETDAQVSLSHLGDALPDVNAANRDRLRGNVDNGRISAYPNSAVKGIGDTEVQLEIDGRSEVVAADDVIVQIGGVLPTAMLARMGVSIERHFGEETEQARQVPDHELFDRIRAQARAKGLQNFHVSRNGPGRVAKWLTALLCLGALGAVFLLGSDYYLTPETVRRSDPSLALFKGSGLLGHGLGVLAGLLMIINLTYFFRKELKIMSGVGNIHTWMFIHQASGLLSGAVVLLHTALVLRNAFAVALYAALGIVVATGIIGRYIYGMVPLDPRGRPLTHEALVDLSKRMEKLYVALFGELDAAVEVRKILNLSFVPRLSLPGLVIRLFTTWPLRHLRLLRIIWRAKQGIAGRVDYREFKRYSSEMFRLRLQMDLAPKVKGILSSWRSGHALLAILTATLVVAHVIVETWVGYRWLF